jgi:hypothetical protein
MEILKQHWITSKETNELMIVQNLIQIEMAKEVIKLCEKKIAEFPEEPKQEIAEESKPLLEESKSL